MCVCVRECVWGNTDAGEPIRGDVMKVLFLEVQFPESLLCHLSKSEHMLHPRYRQSHARCVRMMALGTAARACQFCPMLTVCIQWL